MTPRPPVSPRTRTRAGTCAAADRPQDRRRPDRRRAPGRRRRGPAAAFAVSVLAGAVLLPAAADAQTGGYVTLNGGIQAASTRFTDRVQFTEFREDAEFSAAYDVGGGAVFDAGGGVRLAGGLGFGVAASRFETRDPVSVDARIPHPFFFDRPRSLTGAEPGQTRRETAVHVEVRWFAPTGGRVELAIVGGPTFFSLRQDLVTGVEFDHAYPYDEATYTGASTTTASASAIGFHAGADVGFFFSEAAGVGLLVRYSRGSVDLPGEDAHTVSADAGGFQAGAGLRLRF